jgi:hypothetical protein
VEGKELFRFNRLAFGIRFYQQNQILTCFFFHIGSLSSYAADSWPRWKGTTTMNKADDGFTKRILLSLVTEVVEVESYAKRIRIQVAALAKEHGIKMPIPAA